MRMQQTKKLISIVVMSGIFAIAGISSFAAEQTPAASPPASIQYDLAFPGILPDHPLFKLKVLRDKITALFTRDPTQKIQFYVRQADKGILATAILLEKGNIPLANETALKAEHNMTMMVMYLPYASLRKDSELLEKIRTASLKHQEVLGVLINRVAADQQQTLKTVYEFSVRNLQSVEQFESEFL